MYFVVLQEFEEQVECMKMKDETLSSSLQFMQQEQDKLSQENKVLYDSHRSQSLTVLSHQYHGHGVIS